MLGLVSGDVSTAALSYGKSSSAHRHYTIREPLQWLVRASVLCNESDLRHRNNDWVGRGDAVDVALLSLGYKFGWNHAATLDLHPQVNQIPFEPEHQFAASFNLADGGVMVFVKGAPERVLENKRPWEDDGESH